MSHRSRRRGPTGSPPWWTKPRLRIAFEHPARVVHGAGLRARVGSTYELGLPVDVPTYGRRHIRIVFQRYRGTPTIYADGPSESPHRYGDGALCLWRSDAPREMRWVRADGLRMLIALIVLHLLREALWRDHEEWFGPEAPHGPLPDSFEALEEAS
jgi:hypothetical protein